MSEAVSCVVSAGLASVRLSRPEKRNALTIGMLSELVATARRLRRDRTLRAVVLAGDADAFCAGLDVEVLGRPGSAVRAFVPVPWRGTNLVQEACWAWRRVPVPVIAAVHGHCLGAGLQLALAADFRFATADSQWSVREGAWGLVPDMTGAASLRQLVGIDVAKRLAMTAETISGTDAARLGLVTELASDPVTAAQGLAGVLAGRSPDALAAAKRLLDSTWTASPRRTFARERAAQLPLLFAANTRAVREAAARRGAPRFHPRGHR